MNLPFMVVVGWLGIPTVFNRGEDGWAVCGKGEASEVRRTPSHSATDHSRGPGTWTECVMRSTKYQVLVDVVVRTTYHVVEYRYRYSKVAVSN